MSDHVWLERLPALRVAKLVVNSSTPENDSLTGLVQWAEARGITGGAYRLFGYDNCEPEPNHIYTALITVGPEVEGEGAVQVEDLPGGLYAMTGITGIPQMQAGFARLKAWRQAQGYGCGEHPYLEELLSPLGTPEEAIEMRLWLPLAEAG